VSQPLGDPPGPPPLMQPAGTYRRQVPVSKLRPFLTPTEDVYVIAHMGIAHVPVESWELRIEGLVERPIRLDFHALVKGPSATVQAVLECYGNPVEPDVPTRRVGNVLWRGAPLWPLLQQAGLDGRATCVWLEAPDHGSFAGMASDRYIKDVPLEIVRERLVLLAWEMNGAPLSVEHGFPVRAVLPGFFGANSVKWLSRIYVTDARPESLFTTKLYNRRVLVGGVERLEPVRDLDVHAVIVTPAEGDTLSPGRRTIEGWAWSAGPVERVEVSTDGGTSWREARLEPRLDGYTWQRFVLDWTPPTAAAYELQSRATDDRDRLQPAVGRNRIHTVTVTVA